MSAYTLKERLEIARSIAEQAGQMIIEARQNQSFGRHLKAGDELVTDADIAVDRFISKQLALHFPDETRLSEELSPDQAFNVSTPQLWVVDPIDGTVNFAQGLRHVAVSIGWLENGVAKIGVVHAPFLNETFTAADGFGAYCNDKPIAPSEARELAHSLVATGFPYQREARDALLPRLAAVLANCRDMRRNGAAALDICDVACGRLDAYYESVSPWDFVAGWVIAREAGARIGHLYDVPDDVPEDLYSKHLLVSAPAIYSAMANLLRDADSHA
ncbi:MULTISPECIES: inositol monophosphatase family protein [unclassified Halomonas]|uniref:inositol monophosphatase family protein n=1 Tax=unclassified Halomonas TaxID=2609666 RepID=UPI0006DBD4F0|nr:MULTISPECIES: inositol monophosphatase family protein [unclassified Halomonas]KPQ18949.1 MAG: myo-inositol-1(or 4)-monophosphatase [Halomonas sp. HL-93]SBR48963.1 myo-inositol-1(or 4)-monophosphatase [Halomonas sp. HL-93]SNY96020.1 myo-inositol-1(or 4)-monophosphatase [Halomonas sp. hl-4]